MRSGGGCQRRQEENPERKTLYIGLAAARSPAGRSYRVWGQESRVFLRGGIYGGRPSAGGRAGGRPGLFFRILRPPGRFPRPGPITPTTQGPIRGRWCWDDPAPGPSKTIAPASGPAAYWPADGRRRRADGGPPRHTKRGRGDGRPGPARDSLPAFWSSGRPVRRSFCAPFLDPGCRFGVPPSWFAAARSTRRLSTDGAVA